MKALIQVGYGDIKESLQFQEVDIPKISDDEILVKVKYASINPHDYKIIRGAFKKFQRLRFPAQVGSDFSGIIEAVGSNIDHFVAGDQVFGTTDGALAEYCTINASKIYLKPNKLNFNEASSLPVVGMTTIQAFSRIEGINNGDKILIHAGSGGVGTFAIQYAKARGAFIYTTTSTSNIDWVKELGVDRVIDYKKESYLDICSDLDIVFDTLGGQYTFDAFKVIKKGGRIVSLLPAEMNSKVAKELRIPKIISFLFSLKSSKIKKLVVEKNAQYEFIFMKPSHLYLRVIEDLVNANIIKPIIEKSYDFKNVIVAFEKLATGHTKGKLTIKIAQNE